MTTPTRPSIGGMQGTIPWTRGKQVINKNTIPITPFCTRPEDPDKLMSVYKAAKTPLDLKYDGADNVNYSLAVFGSLAFHHLEEHGMDSVFLLHKGWDQVQPLDSSSNLQDQRH